MARSQQTFSKREREKKRLEKRKEKQKKREERKAESEESGGGIPFAYVDKDGNLTDTPQEKRTKSDIDPSSIEVSTPKKVYTEEELSLVRTGKVSYFDHSKGFGFIIDNLDQEKYFCHHTGLIDDISENDTVTFELEKGLKGMNAVKVTLVK